jgi:hypothetical protein
MISRRFHLGGAMEQTDIAHELALAQLQRARLDNEKLTHELEAQRRARPWYQLPIQLVPLVTALVSVVGFLWGVMQYTGQQQKNRAEREAQSKREMEITERQFMEPWLKSQRDIYTEALDAAVAIANGREFRGHTTAEEKFWQLYHGRMILVETEEVSGAMKRFGECLGATRCASNDMNTLAHELATAMAKSMAAAARMKYAEFSSHQFQYTSGRER